MGIKRIVIAVSVIIVVLGLIVLLLFQSGVDEKIVASLLPKVENRFGISIKYGSIDASLTSLSLDDVRIAERSTGCRLASAKEININVRVGPLFLGKVDLTGIRIDEFEIRIGEKAKGCSLSTLRNLIDNSKKSSNPGGKQTTTPSFIRPEVQLKAGKIMADNGFVAFSIDQLSGRIGTNNRSVFKSEHYQLSNNQTPLMRGSGLEIDYTPDNGRISISSEQTNFEVIIDRNHLMAIARNFNASIDQIRDLRPEDPIGASQQKPSHGKQRRISWRVDGGTFTLINPKVPDKRILIRDIAVDTTLSGMTDIICNSTGTLPGADATFSLSLISDTQGRKLSLKIPDTGLSHFGSFLVQNPHIDWRNASMDGEFHASFKNDADEIELSGQTVFTNLTIRHERLSDEAIKNLDMSTEFELRYSPQNQMLHLERLLISRKLAKFILKGDIRTDRLAFNLDMSIPQTPCKHIREAIPDALIPKLKHSILDGTLFANIRLELDSETPEEVVFSPTINNQCRFKKFGNVPEPSYFKGPFTYVAYTKDKEPIRLVSGPGTDRWTPYREISSFLIDTVLTTEDGKFRHHAGITAPEIRRAIELNLKKESLRHGASTITMQLAKNLMLDRSRTVSRKLQEIVLVWYLESNFSKDELLELYFNVVEFGPSIYGIRDASLHYFGREPYDLNIVESVYLVKLLPNPPVRYRSYERGKVGEKQLRILRRVMKTMHDRRRLTDVELTEGLSQAIVFHKQGYPLPEPRIRTAQLLTN